MGQQRFLTPFLWLVISAGAVVCLLTAYRLPSERLDMGFLMLTFVATAVTSRLIVRIPRLTSHISVSDTLIFLAILLYGGEAAVLLAVAEAVCSSLLFTRKKQIILFNTAAAAVSTFITAQTLQLFFGSMTALTQGQFTTRYIAVLGLMALLQYTSISLPILIATALRTCQPVWQTWRQHYLWSSIAFLAGASAAGITAKLIGEVSFFAILLTSPMIAIVFFTYRTYLRNMEASIAQAEQAERHVEELSHFIAEQERIREQFTQLEKLSALGELASGVAHDLNNTLSGILARAQLLQRTNDPAKIRRGLDIIIQTAEDGAKTVKRIQDFARQRRDHDFAPVAVDQLLCDVSEITRPRWKDQAEASNIHINLETRIDSSLLVMGDDSELRDVLVNMVFNAVDAMPAGGTLTLAAEERDGFVEILVGDTGTGMSQEVRSHVFDPFFTTKGKAGLGLGLAVSYGIIRRHEGIIEVESEIGCGTTFRVRLPLAKAVAQAESANTPAAHTPSFSSEKHPLSPSSSQANPIRILIVDDEDYVCELLRDILIGEGCEVTTASSGPEGLRLFERGSFEAVLTDVGMPEMSGWEFARAIRERAPSIPIAVITGWGEAVGADMQKAAEVDWVITKPFTTERIAALTREVAKRQLEKSRSLSLNAAAA
jgi:signal transduction histidine kinase/CheY-like chemotaxis protein